MRLVGTRTDTSLDDTPHMAAAASHHNSAMQNAREKEKSGRLLRIGSNLLTVILLGLAYLLLLPSPIDPVAYQPPPKPEMKDVWAPNHKLRTAEAIATGKLRGPEDVAVDAKGRIYTGLADGRIVRIEESNQVHEFVNTGGRPLGLAFDAQGNLFVADALKGLLRVEPDGKMTTLVTEVDGQPLGFCDDLDVSRDGIVYFSDASTKFGNGDYLYDLLEGRPHGRLISYPTTSGETKVLLDQLYFANGVALSQNEDFVLVNETYRFRISRYWLKGPQAGQSDIFLDNLPGFPDNLTSNRQGKFWLALFTVRNDELDWLSPRPFLKRQLAKLPKRFWPAPDPYGLVVAIDGQGQVLESLQDPGGQAFREITAAHEQNGHLYLGSLSNDRIGRYKLP